MAVLRLGGEGLADHVVAAHIKQMRALKQHVRDHQEHHICAARLFQSAHVFQELRVPPGQRRRVAAGDLTDGEALPGYVELLAVRAEELLHAPVGPVEREQRPAQLVQRDVRDAREPFGQSDVAGRTGGGLEHHGVGEDRSGHQPRHGGGGSHAVLLVHAGDDGGGAAHRLVAHTDGLSRLNIRQTMMIDDLQKLRLLQTGHGLGDLVVVHQHGALAPRPQQVEPGESANDMLLLIQDGIAAVSGGEHRFPDIVQIVGDMESDHIAAPADAADGKRLIDKAGHLARAQRSGENDGPGAPGPLPPEVGPAEDQAAHPRIHGAFGDLGLISADHDRLRYEMSRIVVILRQGDGQFARDRIDLSRVVYDCGLEHAQQVGQGDIPDHVVSDGLHVAGRDIAGGKHAVESPVLIDDGKSAERVIAHDAPGVVQGDGVMQQGRAVEIQVGDLRAQIPDQLRSLRAEAVQQLPGLVVDGAETGRTVFPVAQGVAQIGVGQRRDDGIGVRVAVTGDINVVHKQSPGKSIKKAGRDPAETDRGGLTNGLSLSIIGRYVLRKNKTQCPF